MTILVIDYIFMLPTNHPFNTKYFFFFFDKKHQVFQAQNDLIEILKQNIFSQTIFYLIKKTVIKHL